jgi:hypothetical protein
MGCSAPAAGALRLCWPGRRRPAVIGGGAEFTPVGVGRSQRERFLATLESSRVIRNLRGRLCVHTRRGMQQIDAATANRKAL